MSGKFYNCHAVMHETLGAYGVAHKQIKPKELLSSNFDLTQHDVLIVGPEWTNMPKGKRGMELDYIRQSLAINSDEVVRFVRDGGVLWVNIDTHPAYAIRTWWTKLWSPLELNVARFKRKPERMEIWEKHHPLFVGFKHGMPEVTGWYYLHHFSKDWQKLAGVGERACILLAKFGRGWVLVSSVQLFEQADGANYDETLLLDNLARFVTEGIWEYEFDYSPDSQDDEQVTTVGEQSDSTATVPLADRVVDAAIESISPDSTAPTRQLQKAAVRFVVDPREEHSEGHLQDMLAAAKKIHEKGSGADGKPFGPGEEPVAGLEGQHQEGAARRVGSTLRKVQLNQGLEYSPGRFGRFVFGRRLVLLDGDNDAGQDMLASGTAGTMPTNEKWDVTVRVFDIDSDDILELYLQYILKSGWHGASEPPTRVHQYWKYDAGGYGLVWSHTQESADGYDPPAFECVGSKCTVSHFGTTVM